MNLGQPPPTLARRIVDAALTGLSAGGLALIVGPLLMAAVGGILVPFVGPIVMWIPLAIVGVVTVGVTVVAAYGSWCLTREALRRAAGQCPRCGYDLRASPDRCPECGRRIH